MADDTPREPLTDAYLDAALGDFDGTDYVPRLVAALRAERAETARLREVERAASVVLDDFFDATKLSHLRLRDALARVSGGA